MLYLLGKPKGQTACSTQTTTCLDTFRLAASSRLTMVPQHFWHSLKCFVRRLTLCLDLRWRCIDVLGLHPPWRSQHVWHPSETELPLNLQQRQTVVRAKRIRAPIANQIVQQLLTGVRCRSLKILTAISPCATSIFLLFGMKQLKQLIPSYFS